MIKKTKPTLDFELAVMAKGYKYICGVDEVGRGAWAGPFVASAVILPKQVFSSQFSVFNLGLIDDSKKLNHKQREEIAEELKKVCDYGIGRVEVEELDRLGMTEATQLAFQRAVDNLIQKADFVLADGFPLKGELPCQAIIKGDSLSLSIAAASIIAKVHRDNLMKELDSVHVGYEFSEHKGYGTKLHQEKLAEHGPCQIHRKSFAPIKKFFT